MNKPFTGVELSLATPSATKRQRLQRFADVIRSGPLPPSLPLHQSGIPRRRRVEVSLASWFAIGTRSNIASCTPPA